MGTDLCSQLESAAAGLQASVERQDFAAAKADAARYGGLLQRAALELSALEAAPHMVEGGRRLEDARRKLCVARARIGDRWRRLNGAAGYRPTKERRVHTWSVQG